MFKARGTRTVGISREADTTPDLETVPAPISRQPDTTAATTGPEPDHNSARTKPAPSAHQAKVPADLPPNEPESLPMPDSFGLPMIPVDFLDQVRAAQSGDLAAIELVREIGALVPEDRRILFMMHVQTLLDERDSTD